MASELVKICYLIFSHAFDWFFLCFVFSWGGELPTGWSVGGSCQDRTCRGGAGTEEAKREETVFSKVKASMHPASGWVKEGYAKMF